MDHSLAVTRKNGVMTISILGGLDAHLVQPLRDVFADLEIQDRQIVIDLAKAEYVDSAGLGLMIYMNKKTKGTKIKTISVIHSNERIQKVFHTMCFEQMFDISHADTA